MPTSIAARPVGLLAVNWVCRLALAAGLAVDAYVHAHLAGDFDAVRATVSQGDLFRVEAGIASLVALLVLVLPHRQPLNLGAVAVAGSALGAVLLYRYVNVGALGPLPNMYEPVWYFQKSLSAGAEAIALLAAVIGVILTRRANRATLAGKRAS